MSSELRFAGGGHVRPLIVQRNAQARRMRLSVDPRDGTVKLLLPKRAALKAAMQWAEGQRAWIEAALEALPQTQPIVAGGTIPFEGGTVRVEWSPDHPRTPALLSDVLRVGGPEDALSRRVLRWLQQQALARLEAETRRFADKAGVTVTRVAIGDARGRWGSCSASGDIRYSWRLILAPPAVLEATVAHEVAHRLHMDHSPAFHAAAEALLGRDGKAERAWLRRHGASLHWIGRG